MRIFIPDPDEPVDVDEPLIRCPQCGFVGVLDSFDVLGADLGNLFCPECHHEDVMEDVEEPKL